jgi:hypothetical protein
MDFAPTVYLHGALRVSKRLRIHHGTLPSAVRIIVRLALAVFRKIADLPREKVDNAARARASGYAVGKDGRNRFREKREYVDCVGSV